MEPRFSFNYDGIPFPELNCTVRQEGDDTVYTLPDGLELTCHVQREDDYGIVRWVNSWHNPTDHDSGRITDLYDCDITVPFDPDPPRTRRNRQSTWEPDMLRLWITEGANVSDTDHRLIPHRLWAGDSHHAHCEAGRSGYGTAPFFDVERRGHGILLAAGRDSGRLTLTARPMLCASGAASCTPPSACTPENPSAPVRSFCWNTGTDRRRHTMSGGATCASGCPPLGKAAAHEGHSVPSLRYSGAESAPRRSCAAGRHSLMPDYLLITAGSTRAGMSLCAARQQPNNPRSGCRPEAGRSAVTTIRTVTGTSRRF